MIATPTVLVGAATFIIALAIQWRTYTAMPFAPGGDESEYLRRGGARDPFQPDPFLRVPLLILLCKLFSGRKEPIMLTLGLLSALTAATATSFAFAHWGAIALVPCGFWTLLPERAALAYRVWPEPILVACATAIVMILVSLPPFTPLWLGLVCCAATATRIDGSAWAPMCSIALHAIQGSGLAESMTILLPTIAILSLLSIINGVRHGVPLPDTTLFFNLVVMGRDRTNHMAIETLVRGAYNEWRDQSSTRDQVSSAVQALQRLLTSPLIALGGLVRRCFALLGIETFVSELLIRLAYPAGETEPTRLGLGSRSWTLRFGGSVLLGSALGGALFSLATAATSLWFAFPSLAVLIASILAHTRTRFRQPLMPVAVFVIAATLVQTPPQEHVPLALTCSGFVGLLMLSTRFVTRPERSSGIP